MGEVIEGGFITRLDLPPERVLNKALEKNLEGVVVLGFLKTGDTYMASSYADGGTVMWLIERVKWALHKVADEMESENG